MAEIALLAFKVSTAFSVFVYSLHASREELLFLVRRPRLLALTIVAIFVLTPTAAVVVAEVFSLKLVPEIAMIAIAIAPASVMIRVQERKAGGAGAFSIGIAASVTLASIVLTPLLVMLIGRIIDKPYGLSPTPIAVAVGIIVLLPFAAGTFVRTIVPNVWDRIGPQLARVASTLMMLSSIALVLGFSRSIIQLADLRIVLGMATFALLALGAGHLLGGPAAVGSFALAIACANRFTAVALTAAAEKQPIPAEGTRTIHCLALRSS